MPTSSNQATERSHELFLLKPTQIFMQCPTFLSEFSESVFVFLFSEMQIIGFGFFIKCHSRHLYLLYMSGGSMANQTRVIKTPE
jgi:hypothetical protein